MVAHAAPDFPDDLARSSEAAQVPGGRRAPADVRRHADARHLLGAQQRPHGGRAGRLRRRRNGC